MAKFRDRVCIVCGEIEHNTATRSETCMKCYKDSFKKNTINEERARLGEVGYTDIEGPTHNRHGQRQWTFTHSCGKQQTWSFFNILKRLKEDPSSVPCSKCGGYRRMMNAHAAWMVIYGITEEQCKLYEKYKRKVITLSDKTFKLHEAELNPLGLVRGMSTWHLDHKEPIIEGFLRGAPPEEMARKENLELLPAKLNLSKGRKWTRPL